MDARRSRKATDSSLLRLKKSSLCSARSKKSATRDRDRERPTSFLQSVIPAAFRPSRSRKNNVVHPICNVHDAKATYFTVHSVAQEPVSRADPGSVAVASGYRVIVQVLHGLDLVNPCSSNADCARASFLPTAAVTLINSSAVGDEQHQRSYQALQHARNHTLWSRESVLEARVPNPQTAPWPQSTPAENQETHASCNFSIAIVLSSSCSRHRGDGDSNTCAAIIGETETLRLPVKGEDYELAQFVPVWRQLSSKKSALGPYAVGKIKLRVRFEVEKPAAVIAPVQESSSPQPAVLPVRPSFLPANFAHALNTKRKQLKATITPEPDETQQLRGAIKFDSVASEIIMKEITEDPRLRQIPVELVEFLDRVGEGVHSSVLHGRLKSRDGQSHVDVAIKEFRYQQAFPPPNVLTTFHREYQLLEKCTSEDAPQIVKFLGVLLEPRPAIVTEFFPSGSLAHCMQNAESWRKVSLFQRVRIAVQVAEALSWLHAHDIVHRDVKSHNILVDRLDSNAPVAKICDVGSAVYWTSRDQLLTEETGSSGYAAPEIFTNEGYTSKADVWSFSIVLWELLNSVSQEEQTPKDHHRITNPFAGIASDKFVELARSGVRPSCCFRDIDPQFEELLQKCWQFDPTERPSMSKIVARLHAIITTLYQQ